MIGDALPDVEMETQQGDIRQMQVRNDLRIPVAQLNTVVRKVSRGHFRLAQMLIDEPVE